ncbi:MAG: recombination regulator RecX [Burkholderiales bacterium]|nr:recombination regulator RecX [Burkholderiales bacterium]
MTAATPSLTARALRLLSTREHSRAELERKLARFEESPGQLATVLDSLQAKDFINQQRVVESVLYQRSAKRGSLRIKHELQAKGLEPEAIASAMEQLRGSELERAREIWRKKFTAAPSNAAERGKQTRFLASRGFGGDTIGRILQGSDDDGL